MTGDLTKATRWAAWAGRFVAWTLMAFGILLLFAGDFGQGLWLLLIGWFLNNAARASWTRQALMDALRGVSVERLMRTRWRGVDPDTSIEQVVRDLMADESEQRAFPVERDREIVGLVCLSDLRKVPQARWGVTPISAVMTPREQLATLPPGAPAQDALEQLARHEVDQIPVVEGAHAVGMVRRADILRWVRLQGGSRAATTL
jgi:signal-transduction protein with cAMP-binding, CBS, and nucleotidyltransferase domain